MADSNKVLSLFRETIQKSSGKEGELVVTVLGSRQVRIETRALDGSQHREIFLSNETAYLVYKILEFIFTKSKVLF